MNIYTLTLDLDKTRRVPNQPVGLRQGDKLGTTIVAQVFDHGQPLTTTGMTPYLLMELPDRQHYYRKQGTFTNNVATINVDETEAASVAGLTENAYIEIRQGSTAIASTGTFTVRILRDAISGRTVPDSYDDRIEDAISDLEDATAAIPAQVTSEVYDYLTEHGVTVGYAVADGDLTITLT